MACCCNNSFRDIKLRLNGKSIIASNKSDGLEEGRGMVVNISCNSYSFDERRPRWRDDHSIIDSAHCEDYSLFLPSLGLVCQRDSHLNFNDLL